MPCHMGAPPIPCYLVTASPYPSQEMDALEKVTVKFMESVSGKMSSCLKSSVHHLVRETNLSHLDRKLEAVNKSLEKSRV